MVPSVVVSQVGYNVALVVARSAMEIFIFVFFPLDFVSNRGQSEIDRHYFLQIKTEDEICQEFIFGIYFIWKSVFTFKLVGQGLFKLNELVAHFSMVLGTLVSVTVNVSVSPAAHSTDEFL